MHARAVNIQFHSGKINGASLLVKDSIVPVMKGQKRELVKRSPSDAY